MCFSNFLASGNLETTTFEKSILTAVSGGSTMAIEHEGCSWLLVDGKAGWHDATKCSTVGVLVCSVGFVGFLGNSRSIPK